MRRGWQPPKSEAALELERDPPVPYTIPDAPALGSAENPHVVSCRLPGGNLCTCAVPDCSAENVRNSLANQLRVPVELLSGHALLMHAASLELWDECKPLPPTFFKPVRRNRQWMTPFLQLRRVRTAAHQHGTAIATVTPYLLALLDSEQILDDLRAGNLPLELVLATSPASLLDVSALVLHLSIGSSDATIHATWLLSRTLPSLLPSLLPALREHHAPLLLRHKQLSSRLDAAELEAEQRDAPYRNVPHSPRLYCSGPRHSTRGVWGGAIGTAPNLAARSALVETTRLALRTPLDIPNAGDDSNGTTLVNFSACQLFAGGRIGRTAYSLAIGPLGLVLLKSPRRQRIQAAAAAAVAAASSSANAHVEPVSLPQPPQQQQPPNPLASATSATSATRATIAGAGDARLLDGLCARIPWEAVLEVQAASARSIGLVVSSAAASNLRQLHGGAIGASHRRSGGRVLRLTTAQAPLIACVLQAHERSSSSLALESSLKSTSGTRPVVEVQQPQAPAMAGETDAGAPAEVLITRI